MHNKGSTAYYQEQQAFEANTDNSWAIHPGSVWQTHSDRPFRRHSKTNWKTNTYEQQIHPQRTIKKHSKWNSYEWPTTRKHEQQIPEITLVNWTGG